MAIFNITNNKKLIYYFRASNIDINISTVNIRISKLQL